MNLTENRRQTAVNAAAATAALAAALALAGPAAAQAPVKDAAACAALAGTAIDHAAVTLAEVGEGEGLPAFCKVQVKAEADIGIEVRLPLEGWNGKLYQAGCGGFCGVLGRADSGPGVVNAMRPGLEKHYATATSDSGHTGESVVDATFAHDNPDGERDWGWRSIGETNRIAGALIEAFYGEAPARAYFQGCSTGGRMANRAALTYPEMFDGIISGAPALDYPGLVATAFSFFVNANLDASGAPILTADDYALIGAAVMESCDAKDGTADGVIADPRQCKADLSALACTAGSTEGCLTDAKMDVLAAWREGPRNAAGDPLYPGGIPEGSEAYWAKWMPAMGAFATNFGRYMAFPNDPGPDWTTTDFDFETDPAEVAKMNEVYNADDPDLSAFIAAGGKMIVYHGWADPLVTPYKTVEWYEAAKAANGGEAFADTARLFMIPGMDHCGIYSDAAGIGQSRLDLITPIEAWVEEGTAPESILKP